MPGWMQDALTAIESAKIHDGGVIVVQTKSQQGLVAQALRRMHPELAESKRLTLALDTSAQQIHWRNAL